MLLSRRMQTLIVHTKFICTICNGRTETGPKTQDAGLRKGFLIRGVRYMGDQSRQANNIQGGQAETESGKTG